MPSDARRREKTRYPGVYRFAGKYQYCWRDQNGKQRWGTEATVDAARKMKARREATHSYSDAITLHEFALEWIDRYQGRTSRGFRESTRTEYRVSLLNHILPFMGRRLRVTDVTPRHIKDLVAHLAKKRPTRGPLNAAGKHDPLSDRSIRRIIAPLRACLADAVEEGLIGSNPCTGVRLPVRQVIEEDEDRQVKSLTHDQLGALLTCAPAAWRDLILLLALTGLRISEALPLRWQDVELDGDAPRVKVRRAWRKGEMGPPKSKFARRDVPLAPTLVDALRSRKKAAKRPKATDLIFPDQQGNLWNGPSIYRDSIKPAAEEAGVGWAGFHTLRHTCATRLFDAGRNAVQVQHWLGHHSAAFTIATYVHLMDNDLGSPLDAPPMPVDDTAADAAALAGA